LSEKKEIDRIVNKYKLQNNEEFKTHFMSFLEEDPLIIPEDYEKDEY
jgi:hypothetical protein